MSTLLVNGQEIVTSKEMNLLDFLRDDLNLTSVKNGCSEGACGACMVLIDGKAARACLFKLDKLDGKKITTVEGLSQREKDVFGWSYAHAGAVQCGFCMPGMVISTKGLLDVNPDPTPADITKALAQNMCRCTGYVKIEQAVLASARLLREGAPVPLDEASTGSTTRGSIGAFRIARATTRTAPDPGSSPVFTADTVKPPSAASTWARISASGTRSHAVTRRVSWAVTAVTAVRAWPPMARMVLWSTWMPAPPPLSEPAIVRTQKGELMAASP